MPPGPVLPHPQVLEDIALTCQMQLASKVPLCAFNGGNDVFVDVGNKSLGLQSLMAYFKTQPHEVGRGGLGGLGEGGGQEANMWAGGKQVGRREA